MIHRDLLRPCQFNEQKTYDADRFQVESWIDGYFHKWSESPHGYAIVEKASDGKIELVHYKGIRFTKNDEES